MFLVAFFPHFLQFQSSFDLSFEQIGPNNRPIGLIVDIKHLTYFFFLLNYGSNVHTKVSQGAF